LVLIQLEIPMESVEFAAKLAKEKGKLVILNPAPAPSTPLSLDLLKNIYLINPNEIEAEIISGIKVTDTDTAVLAAKKINEMGVSNVIITLGSKGALLYDGINAEFITGHKVKALDSTGAGDCFSGALVIAISEGAQSSIPYRAEVDIFNLN